MPIAHTCASCGLDLSRIAAPLDPIYRLPIVVCPECAAASVRRTDGHRLFSRNTDRVVNALKQLIATPLVWMLLLFAVLTPAILNADLLRRSGLSVWSATVQALHLREHDDHFINYSTNNGTLALMWLFAAGAAAGAYLATALPHLRRRVVIPLFVLLLLGALFLPGAVEYLTRWIESGMRGRSVRSLRAQFRTEIGALSTLAAAALAAPIGIPLGYRFRRIIDGMGRRRWRRLRRRIRKRRQGT